MSAVEGVRERGRIRQYLSSRLGSSSTSTPSAHESGTLASLGVILPAQPTGQGTREDFKPRKRNQLFRLFRSPASGRPPSPRLFKRSTLEKDLTVLSTKYLMEDCGSLKELILAIVALSAKCKNEKAGFFSHQIAAKCANFCLCLIQYIKEDSLSATAVDAVEDFSRVVKAIQSFDYDLEVSLTDAEERVDQSITAIKASHPFLVDTKGKGRSHRGLSSTAVTLLDISIPVVTFLKEVIETVGAVPFLKPVLAAVLTMSQAARQTQSNFDEMLSLSATAGDFVLRIVERCSALQETPPKLDDAVKKLESRLHTLASRCQEMSQKSFISCFFQSTTFKDDLEDLRRMLDIAIQEFQSTNLIDIQDALQRITEALRRTANNVELGRLKELPTHPDMSGMQAEYLVESRTPDLEKICEWIESSTDLLLCIHGTAGVGKSTLASHLSKKLRAAGRLAGSVFLGAFSTVTSGPETIIKMLAHEIGSVHPRAIPKILQAMQECHGTSLQTHLQKYILDPLIFLNQPHPLVVIVDAFDEWRDHPTFIQSLAFLGFHASVVKVIGTSRFNPVASRLPGIGEVSVRTYHLVPVSTEVMKAYFEKHLKSVPWVDGRMASGGDIDKLAELSGGLPIWAATVISLLSHQLSEFAPHEVLADIVGSRRQVGGSDGLGEMYQNALRRLFNTPDARKYFRRYFGAIITLQEPLSLSDFSTLVGIPVYLVTKIQATLLAVQTRLPPPGSEKMIHPATTLFHLSLIEHVQTRSTETSFEISTFDSHAALGMSCLKQVADLPSPSPPHSVRLRAIQRYAVKFWPLHVSNGTLRSQAQWSQTEHCSTLKAIPSHTQRHWAILFHKSLVPEKDGLVLEVEDRPDVILTRLAHQLGENGGDQWRFQAACLELAIRIDDRNLEAWSRLGLCYEARGDRMGSLQMCEEAVVAFRHALELLPDSHPDHAEALDSVANALWSCHTLDGNHDTLNESISKSRMALSLCPAPHPERHRYLNTLAIALQYRYDREFDLETLTEVISLHREKFELCPGAHPGRSATLNNLASSLRSLHMRDRNVDSLKESISLQRQALALRPAPHPYRSSSLDNLANALNTLFMYDGDEKASKEALSLYHESLTLHPAPHPDRWRTLNNLAFSLQTRYRRNGDIGTLNGCISLHHEALELLPVGHPKRLGPLNTLADALRLKFERDCRDEDVLEEAISFRRELLLLTSPDGNMHTYRPGAAKRLLSILEKRHEVIGDNRDYAEIEDLKAELAQAEGG